MTEPFFPYCTRCKAGKHPGVPAIEVENLTVGYSNNPQVLNDISFSIPNGVRVALLGHNGAGKSTLLQSLVGLIPIASGDVKICGHPASSGKHLVTYLPQRSVIDWSFPITVFDLALTGSYIYLGWFKRPQKSHKISAINALELLNLLDRKDRLIGELSIGEQQRVLLARALVHSAEVFLLDEPLNAVDQETQAIMQKVFNQMKLEGKTLLMATHDHAHLKEHFDHTLTLKSGKIQFL